MAMATLTITVPDELAEQAITLGLLEPHSMTALLREGIRRCHIGDLFDAADRLSAAELPVMSQEEIQSEIAAARAESFARPPWFQRPDFRLALARFTTSGR
jgi:hypothetical protein